LTKFFQIAAKKSRSIKAFNRRPNAIVSRRWWARE
jgi:hypothetical protein